jgi:glyoxylase-like metal-dependent hydrolase (beta-lactamase superfamily II)
VATTAFLDSDRRLGRCTALIGADNGRYPSGNSVLVAGPEGAALIDPSTAVTARGGVPAAVDRILVSHAHEDHLAGVHLFPDARVHAHEADLLGLHSLDGFMEVYGMPPEVERQWRDVVVRDFAYTERPDATGLRDGDVIDLGGGLTGTVVHLAGHTRGHCGFLVEPEGVFFVGDVDLTGFGPYYGDHWSDLEDFERSIDRCREIDARWYVTFHQKGVVEGRPTFLAMLDAFAGVIADRERRLLEYLAEPHTIEEIAAHRFVYRPGTQVLWADHVERRSMQLHLDRLVPPGRVVEVEPGRYRAVPGA